MGAAVRFKQQSVPRQQGEQARLKVVQGPDYGAIYVITGQRITLGRGEENDIMVSDLKASRRHAEFFLTPVGWHVKDLGSANGLLHNGRATRDTPVQTGDTLTFGETTLEFVAAEAGTQLLIAPPRSGSQLAAERQAFEDQKKRVRSFGVIQGGAGGAANVGGAPAKSGPKPILLIAAAAGLAFMFLGEEPEPTKKPAKKSDKGATEDLSKYLPGGIQLDPATARTAEQFFKAGFREYLAGNYIRARTQFETVLQMAPGHQLATLYLSNCENAIKDEVKFHLEQGKISSDSGKMKESKAHYEAVLRILHRDQSNPHFAEAKDQLAKVAEEMGKSGFGGSR